MEIDDYRLELLNELRNEASIEGNDVDDQFINFAINQLEELGELIDTYPHSCEIRGPRNKVLGFDAYSFDEADGSIVLLISDFQNTIVKTTLTNSRIDELYNKMSYFINEAYNGDIKKYCDDSDPIIDISKELKNRIGNGKLNSDILKFKFFIVTNSLLSTQVKNIYKDDLLERPVELNLWTLERFFQSKISKTSEAIQIKCEDFGIDGIQCLKANLGESNGYDSYMAIVPGKFLADVYLKHGSRLLEGNVRAFLSTKNKVNKRIRATIIGNNPENFFTYNNGIAVVAHSVKLSTDQTRILEFKNFQIINGGQTTATLASVVVKKDPCVSNYSKIFVPMKLTVLNIEGDLSEDDENKYNEITQQISKSANSQTLVSDTDFFSNDPFHVEMEKLSLKHMAPPVNGSPHQTIWYYERSKGRWEQDQMKMTDSQRDKYKLRSPKSQVIKKEKLAKCLNSVYQYPHIVCEGSTNNMKSFAETISELTENSKDNINEFFFEKAVASVILFDSVDRIVNKSPWYPKGSNKAQIVPYTISKICAILPTKKEIDWKKIWLKQMLYPELVRQIEIVSQIAHVFLCDSSGVIVREYAKKASTWKKFKEECNIQLTEEFTLSLIDTSILKDEQKAAKRAHKFNSDIDLEVEFYTRGYDYWVKFAFDMEIEKMLSSGDIDFVKTLASYIKRGTLPSKMQIKKLLKIITKAEDCGYIMPH